MHFNENVIIRVHTVACAAGILWALLESATEAVLSK